jgi:undecaprenyl-diphosphatase
MKSRYIKTTIIFLLIINSLCYAENTIEVPKAPDHKQTISHQDAMILGLVEGISEYLPISSTGHLIITNHILGLDDDTPTAKGYSLKKAADAYAIIIQGGAIIAVLILYWRRIQSIILGILGKNKDGLKLARNLIIAFLPAAFLGFAFHDIIDEYLFNITSVAIALIAGSVLMLIIERWRKNKNISNSPDLHELSIKQVLIIGLLQCIAMCPGTSRSMMTIVGGYVAGLNPVKSAEFSFLLGLITLSAASAYKILSSGSELLQIVDISSVLTGIIVATIAAALSVKWLVSYLTKHGLTIFAYYRIALAITLILCLR